MAHGTNQPAINRNDHVSLSISLIRELHPRVNKKGKRKNRLPLGGRARGKPFYQQRLSRTRRRPFCGGD